MRSMSWRVFGCGRLLILKGRSARQMHGYQGADKVYTIQHANGSAPEAFALHKRIERPLLAIQIRRHCRPRPRGARPRREDEFGWAAAGAGLPGRAQSELARVAPTVH